MFFMGNCSPSSIASYLLALWITAVIKKLFCLFSFIFTTLKDCAESEPDSKTYGLLITGACEKLSKTFTSLSLV